MSKQINDGGQAFGTRTIQRTSTPNGGIAGRDFVTSIDTTGGMSLRDYFAAQVMPALILAAAERKNTIDGDKAVHQAFAIADAMLKARSA